MSSCFAHGGMIYHWSHYWLTTSSQLNHYINQRGNIVNWKRHQSFKNNCIAYVAYIAMYYTLTPVTCISMVSHGFLSIWWFWRLACHSIIVTLEVTMRIGTHWFDFPWISAIRNYWTNVWADIGMLDVIHTLLNVSNKCGYPFAIIATTIHNRLIETISIAYVLRDTFEHKIECDL